MTQTPSIPPSVPTLARPHLPAEALPPAMRADIDRLAADVAAVRTAEPELWRTLLGKLKVRWTTDSNALEGSSLTFAETLFVLEYGLTVEGKPLKDHLDARNHAEAIELLFDFVASRRPLSAGFLKELNALLLDGIRTMPAIDVDGRRVERPTTPGTYKTRPNHVIRPDGEVHRTVEPIAVAAEVDALVAWVEAEIDRRHPVEVAAVAHHDFVRIHPFADGNDRGARILMNLVLIKRGLPPAVVATTERRAYIEALVGAGRGDVGPFVAFIAEATRATLAGLLADARQVLGSLPSETGDRARS